MTWSVLAVAVGCPHAGEISDYARARTNELCESRCESCHRADGRGDGLAALVLRVKPANFTNKEFQRNTSNKQIAAAILQGGAALGLSPEMPPNSDLAMRPEVLQALTIKVRNFGR